MMVACASANQLVARRVATTRREPIATTSYQLLSASALALVYLFWMAPPAQPYQGADGATYGVLCFLILTTAGPFLLYNYALQYLPVGRISLFGPLTGPIGVVLATCSEAPAGRIFTSYPSSFQYPRDIGSVSQG